MHPDRISRQYARVRDDLKQQMSASRKWQSLPALLDELHTLRQQYLAARRSLDLLTEESEKLAVRPVLH